MMNSDNMTNVDPPKVFRLWLDVIERNCLVKLYIHAVFSKISGSKEIFSRVIFTYSLFSDSCMYERTEEDLHAASHANIFTRGTFTTYVHFFSARVSETFVFVPSCHMSD